VAEVGVAEGRFSEEIYSWGVELLFLIDIWEKIPFISGCASFEEDWHLTNLQRVKDLFRDKENVKILKGFSYKMADLIPDESLGLVYIDGDHSYEGTKTDIKYFWPKLKQGGIMAFHDYANLDYGVNRAVIEFIGGEEFVNVIDENGVKADIGAWIRK
jgi:hypothetical protein